MDIPTNFCNRHTYSNNIIHYTMFNSRTNITLCFSPLMSIVPCDFTKYISLPSDIFENLKAFTLSRQIINPHNSFPQTTWNNLYLAISITSTWNNSYPTNQSQLISTSTIQIQPPRLNSTFHQRRSQQHKCRLRWKFYLKKHGKFIKRFLHRT